LNLLPDSYNDTVNILQSNADQTFKDHITHLQNLKTANDNAKALFNKPKGKGQTTASRKPSTQPRSGKPTDLECTWCKSKGHPSKGHIHSTCYKLKKFQEDRKKGVAAVAAEPITSTALVTTSSSSGGFAWVANDVLSDSTTSLLDSSVSSSSGLTSTSLSSSYSISDLTSTFSGIALKVLQYTQ